MTDRVAESEATPRANHRIALHHAQRLLELPDCVLLQVLPSHGKRRKQILDEDGGAPRSSNFSADLTFAVLGEREVRAHRSSRDGGSGEIEGSCATKGGERFAAKAQRLDGRQVGKGSELRGTVLRRYRALSECTARER